MKHIYCQNISQLVSDFSECIRSVTEGDLGRNKVNRQWKSNISTRSAAWSPTSTNRKYQNRCGTFESIFT